MFFADESSNFSGLNSPNLLLFVTIVGIPFAKMMFPKFSVLFILFSFAVVSVGCQSNGTKPSNPFAQNSQTVPPPATFSSQGAYLGQTPGAYIPQTPATTFPAPAPASPPQSAITHSSTVTGTEKAALFSAATKESDWTPVAMTTTSQTAFQAVEAKVAAAGGGIPMAGSESLITGTSHVVTTITDESAALPEPQLLLYSGQYTE